MLENLDRRFIKIVIENRNYLTKLRKKKRAYARKMAVSSNVYRMEKIVAGDLSCEWFRYISPRSFNWKEKNWTGSRLNRWEGPMKTQEFDLYSLPRFVL